MNLEKSDTLDRHDTQEAMPNFQTNDTPPPGHRKRLRMAVVRGFGVGGCGRLLFPLAWKLGEGCE